MIETEVWHYDGRNANRWHPRLVGDAESFRLISEGWESGPWAWADLRALDIAGRDAVFGHATEPGWRIGFADGVIPAAIVPLLPQRARYGGFIDRIGLGKASMALAAVAAAALFVGLKAPGWIAPLVPQSWEDGLGDAMVGDFGGRICRTPEGDAALKALIAKVDPEGQARTIEIANIPMVNAIALPGRRIILFDGLIAEAKSPDEVAGVLGHEMGHVEHRDTMAALLRQLGLSVLLGGMNGTAGSNLNALLSLSYGREAEHTADLSAIERMKAANISPLPTADFFQRLDPLNDDRRDDKKAGKDGAEESVESEAAEAANWFGSHPTSRSRAELFTKAHVKGRTYAPALSSDQWKALKTMCKRDRNAKPAMGMGL